MSLDYNIFLEVAVIPLDIALFVYLLVRYTSPTKVNIAFRRFTCAVMITTAFDVITAIVSSAHTLVPNPVHYFFNMTDSALASLSAFLFIYYIYAYCTMNQTAWKLRNLMNYTLLAVNYLLLLTNPITGWVFTYDDAGNYIHQFLFVPVARRRIIQRFAS